MKDVPTNGELVLKKLINKGVLIEFRSTKGSLTLVRLNRDRGEITRPSEITQPEFNGIWNTLQPTDEVLLRVLNAIAARHYNAVIRPARNYMNAQEEQRAQERKSKIIVDVIKHINNLFERKGKEYGFYFVAPKPVMKSVSLPNHSGSPLCSL